MSTRGTDEQRGPIRDTAVPMGRDEALGEDAAVGEVGGSEPSGRDESGVHAVEAEKGTPTAESDTAGPSQRDDKDKGLSQAETHARHNAD